MQNLVRVRFRDKTTKVVGGLPRHLGAEDRAQSTVALMGLLHGLQGERASNICVEDKDLARVTAQDLVTEMVQASCSAERLIFTKVTRAGERASVS